MKFVARVVTLLLVLATASAAHSQDWDSKGWVERDPRGRRPPSDAGWDSTGWRLLGERSVAGRYDHDTIAVGSYKGRFDKLTMVVTDSDLELIDLEIKFVTGRSYHPATRHYFREGSRSRVFDLPGDDRMIRSIELRYKNVGSGNAKVQIWGR